MGLCSLDHADQLANATHPRLRDILSPPPPQSDRCRSILADLVEPFANGDAKLIAARLIREFGSINALLAASHGRLTGVLPDRPGVVMQILRFANTTTHCKRSKVRAPTAKLSRRILVDYLRHRIGFEPVEVVYAFYFSLSGSLISDGTVARGNFDRCPVTPKEIARAALDAGAAMVVLAHNHPSGDPTPSLADKLITRDIANACRVVDATLGDHIIIGNPDFVTFRELGLL
jgi:DNA repair protein RadC